MDQNNKCHYSEDGVCEILVEVRKGKKGITRTGNTVRCDGYNQNCKFHKTTEQYNKSRDAAIERCRGKGFCGNGMLCKYGCACKTSEEKAMEDYMNGKQH